MTWSECPFTCCKRPHKFQYQFSYFAPLVIISLSIWLYLNSKILKTYHWYRATNISQGSKGMTFQNYIWSLKQLFFFLSCCSCAAGIRHWQISFLTEEYMPYKDVEQGLREGKANEYIFIQIRFTTTTPFLAPSFQVIKANHWISLHLSSSLKAKAIWFPLCNLHPFSIKIQVP